MANLSYININLSIEKGRLISKRNGLDKVDYFADKIVWSTLCIGLIFYPIVAYFHVNIHSSNDKAVAFFLFPLIISFGLYGLWRKLTENNLIVIETSFSRQKNKQYLFDFLKQKNYQVFRESKDIVIVNVEENLSFNNLWTKTMTFIIEDERIYFTIVKNYPRLNPPVFFSHFSLKSDLKKYYQSL